VTFARARGGLAAITAALALGAGAASAGPALVVNSLIDTTAVDGLCTLREAVENHNAMTSRIPTARMAAASTAKAAR